MSDFRIKGASGDVADQHHALGERTVIGRAEDCDVRVDDCGMAPHHAAIVVKDEDSVWLELLTDEGEVSVNGDIVQPQSKDGVALSSGDEIRIASCRWVLQAPGLRPEKRLTQDATRKKRPLWPWLVVGGLLAAATAARYLMP